MYLGSALPVSLGSILLWGFASRKRSRILGARRLDCCYGESEGLAGQMSGLVVPIVKVSAAEIHRECPGQISWL